MLLTSLPPIQREPGPAAHSSPGLSGPRSSAGATRYQHSISLEAQISGYEFFGSGHARVISQFEEDSAIESRGVWFRGY